MKTKSPICRLCSTQDGIFLDLFGSDTQKVSYAEDVSKCLSFEVKKDDGLSSKICIKCVGLLSEIGPFVDKVLQLDQNQGSPRRRKLPSDDKCICCLSSDNHLFPIPKASSTKLKDCFKREFSPVSKICHRCQFHLDAVHELKSKSHSKFNESNSDSCLTSQKEDTVDEIVFGLKKKYKMNKLGENLSQQPKIKVLDVGLAIGGDFFSKGTIRVTEFWDALASTSVQRLSVRGRGGKPGPSSSKVNSNNKSGLISTKKLKNMKAGPLSSKKGNYQQTSSLRVIRCGGPVSSTFVSKKRTNGEKKEDLLDDDTPLKKSSQEVNSGRISKRSREVSESEEENNSKRTKNSFVSPKGSSPSKRSARISNLAVLEESDVQKQKPSCTSLKQSSPSTRCRRIQSSTASEESDFSGSPSSKKRGTRSKATTDGENTAPVAPSEDGITSRNIEDAALDKENDGAKKKRRSCGGSFKKYFDEEEDKNEDDPGIARKRKRRESSDFAAESGTDERSSDVDELPTSKSKEEEILTQLPEIDQPDFLRELDELLKYTPKATFRPFICSVCHEGYISTVKGKLHKLVVHDAHSNVEVKLTRCDESSEEAERLRTLASSMSQDQEDGKVKEVSNGKDSDDSDSDLWQSNCKNQHKPEKSFDDLFSSTQEPVNKTLDSEKKIQDEGLESENCKENSASQEDTGDDSEAWETEKSAEERDTASEGEGMDSQKEETSKHLTNSEMECENDLQGEGKENEDVENRNHQGKSNEIEKDDASDKDDIGEESNLRKGDTIEESNTEEDDTDGESNLGKNDTGGALNMEKDDEECEVGKEKNDDGDKINECEENEDGKEKKADGDKINECEGNEDGQEKEEDDDSNKIDQCPKSEVGGVKNDDTEMKVENDMEDKSNTDEPERNKSPVSMRGDEEDEVKASEADVESDDNDVNNQSLSKREPVTNNETAALRNGCLDNSEELSKDKEDSNKEAESEKNLESVDRIKEDI